MELFETHMHLLDERFDGDREAVAAALPQHGVTRALEACCDAAGIPRVLALCEAWPHIYGSAGVHPHSAGEWDAAAAEAVERALAHPRVVAVGEIGLDYHYDFAPREAQRRAFAEQLDIAAAHGLPVLIHDREAHGDSLRIVCDYPGLRGVFHCFSGSVEMARELLRRGWYLGFDGPITYKNAVKALDVIAACPTDRMLLETDSPYLAPVPNRGKRNDSRNLPYIAARIAEIKSMTTEEVAEVTLQNGKQLFGL